MMLELKTSHIYKLIGVSIILNIADVLTTALCLSTEELFEQNKLFYILPLPLLLLLKFGSSIIFFPITYLCSIIDKALLFIPFLSILILIILGFMVVTRNITNLLNVL